MLLDVAERYPDIALVAIDLDPGIVALWSVVAGPEEEVAALESMLEVEPTRELWERLRVETPADPVRVAFATTYLSRTSFGGSLAARAMKNIGSRYNPAAIRKQIRRARELLRGRLSVTSVDAVAWLDAHRGDEKNVVFVDPPYVSEGNALYRVGMTPREHSVLRDRLRNMNDWVATYRDHPTIRHLYSSWCDIYCSPQGKSELVIVPAGAPGRVPADEFSDSHDLEQDQPVSEVLMAQDAQDCIAVGSSEGSNYDRPIPPKDTALAARRAWSIDELPQLYPYSESTFRNFIDDGILRCHRPNGVRKACVFVRDLEEFEDRVRGV